MECKVCNLAVADLKAYKLHHSISHASKPFVCLNVLCSRTYSGWRSLEGHYKKCNSANISSTNDSTPIGSFNTNAVDSTEAENYSTSVDFDHASTSNVAIENPPVCEDFANIMKCETDAFVSKLHIKSKLPRQYVQDIIEDVDHYVRNGILENLKNLLLSKVDLTPGQCSAVNSAFSTFSNPFSHLSSEYKRFDYFQKSGYYIAPIPYEVGEIDVSVPTSSGPVLKPRKVFGQKIPLDEVLTKYLEMPNCFDGILQYMNSLNFDSETKENFIQCKLWKLKRSKYSEDDIVFPLHIYYDDVECNNPLGSRSMKLGAVYASIPCLPPECQSTLEDIFLVLIFETWMRNFDDDKVFTPLVDMLRKLECEGILVKTADGEKRVYFVTGLLLGDNLGVNSLGGFVECFVANYFCRFCHTPRLVTNSQSVEDQSSLRSELSYNENVALGNPSLTGVKKNSVLNKVPSFHITSNYSVDVFHDLCEGTCHYVMLKVLKHCIPTYFTTGVLNNRIDCFQYGPCDSNRIPIIHDDLSDRHKLKMSGSETLLFVKMFGLLVGDLVPAGDEYWMLYLKLLQLLDLCLSRSSSQNSTAFKVLVEEFNVMYVNVTGDTLKAKMHNMVHYKTVFDQSGPLSLMSTKRFESKHRSLLIPAHATESRRNISKTVAIQHQLNMGHRLKFRASLLPRVDYGPVCETNLTDFDHYFQFKKSLPECLVLAPSVMSPNWVDIKGTRYKPGMVLLLNVNESGGPIFGVIQCIVMNDNCDVTFLFSYLLTIGFDEHLHAYEVQSSDLWSSTQQENLYDPLPLSTHRSIRGTMYVILRHDL